MFPSLEYDIRSHDASGSVLSSSKSRDPFQLLCLLHLSVMFTKDEEGFIVSFIRSHAASGSVLSSSKSRDPFQLLCLLHLLVLFTTDEERFIASFPIHHLHFSFKYYLFV